jgi:predicted unusual protein kinase regulating ubiquinone biosynthesis (AarF/ABC1/UbiB family)
MSSGEDAIRRLDALLQVGLKLAHSARSGRVALARLEEAIELDWIRPWGERIAADLERAAAATREPLELGDVESILAEAWGEKPSAVLDELGPEPHAVTPAFQVHRGVHEGRAVAIKVTRPGLAGAVRNDLALLESLSAPLGAAFPAVDAAGTLREIRERLLDELDLETEATVQRRFHRALRSHPFLIVPKPVMDLCHEQVLVSEWVDGVPLREAPDPDEACARLVLFVLGAARSGLVNGDPNPDDALVLEDGRLAIVDFGVWREVDPQRVTLGADALDALLAGNPDGFADALGQLGWMPEDRAPEMLTLLRELLDGLIGPGPVRLDHEAVLTVRARLIERGRAVASLLRAGALPPEDLWPARAVAQLLGTIARVGATGPWPELALSAMREGWAATPLGRP